MSNPETYREKALKCARAAGKAHNAGELSTYLALPVFTRRSPITLIAGSTARRTAATKTKVERRHRLHRLRRGINLSMKWRAAGQV